MGRLTLSITVSRTLRGILLSSLFVLPALAQPATLSFNECTSGNPIDPALKINVSTVYGQIVTGEDLGRHLNLTVIGNTGQDIIPLSNTTGKLSTYNWIYEVNLRLIYENMLQLHCSLQVISYPLMFWMLARSFAQLSDLRPLCPMKIQAFSTVQWALDQ